MNTLPKIHPIDAVDFPAYDSMTLDNGIPVYGFNGLPQDVIQIDVLFDAGRWAEPVRLSSQACAALLKSGTKDMTAFELENAIALHGATIRTEGGYHTISVSLYCMLKELEPSVVLLKKVLAETIFPESELALFTKKKIARLAINRKNTEYMADMHFKRLLFGENHPYGYETLEKDYASLEQNHLRKVYQEQIQPANCRMIISGKYDEQTFHILNNQLGQGHWDKEPVLQMKRQFVKTPSSGKFRFPMKDSVQGSIVIGGPAPMRSHEDYNQLILLNTIFGGYFGSRLMSNIREDKGYTYGIYSGFNAYRNDCIFSIGTETATDYIEPCLEEIYGELDRLVQEPPDEEEVSIARNYLMGQFLKKTDGPFNSAVTFKYFLTRNLDFGLFNKTLEDIRAASPESLLNLARKYFRAENFVEVVVG